MSFCVSHRTALDKNIRHIYSGIPSDVRFRYYSNSAGAALDVHDRVWERHKRPPGRFDSKFQEYNPEYKTRMPRAPAFRHVSPEQVQEITSRLTRPTLMTVLRQQPNSTSRASSRSPRRDFSSQMTQRSDLDNGDSRHRKISYKEWSDDESGVYYIDDSTLAEDTSQYQQDNGSDVVAKPVEWRDTPSFERETENGEVYENNDRLFENEETSHEYTEENERELGVNKESGYDANSKTVFLATQNENETPTTNHKKGKSTQGKLNILEEIIQTKNTTSRRNFKGTSSPSPTGEGRKLESRGRISNKINRSPYCEPAPLLRKSPPLRPAQPVARSKNTRTPSPWMRKQGSTGKEPRDLYPPSPSRPQIRAGTGKPRQEPLNAQCRSEFRGTAVYLRPTRSSSAPGYKVHDDKRGIPKKRETKYNENKRRTSSSFKAPVGQVSNHGDLKSPDDRQNQVFTSKSPTENERQSRQQTRRYPSSQSKREERKGSSTKATSATWQTSRSLGSTPVDLRSRSALASRQSEASSRHSPRNSEEIKFTSCCMPAVENDLLVRFGIEPSGRRSFFVSNGKRRFASAAEMEAACHRLMTPTATKLIRDRMRWAPDNNDDLQDPVRVIRETVESKSRRKRSKRKDLTRSDFDGDSQAQQEENEDGDVRDTENDENKAEINHSSKQRGKIDESERFDEDGQIDETKKERNRSKSDAQEQEQSEEQNFRDNNLKQTKTGTAIDFQDKDGVAVVTKSHDFSEDRDISQKEGIGQSQRRSRSRSSSESMSRSRSRSSSGSKSRSSSKSRSRLSSRSRSWSSSKSRSRTVSRSRSRSQSRSSSRSGQRQDIQHLTNGENATTQESQWVATEANENSQKGDSQTEGGQSEGSYENTQTGEERGGEPSKGRRKESGDITKYESGHIVFPIGSGNESVTEADPHSSSSGHLRDISEDDHGLDNQVALSTGSLSRGEPSKREDEQTSADGYHYSKDNENPEKMDERGGDECGRGRENCNISQRQSYGTIRESRSDHERTQDFAHSSVPYTSTDGISYSVQKGYAHETEEGSSLISTENNPNTTDNDEGVGRSTYHRVTFEQDS